MTDQIVIGVDNSTTACKAIAWDKQDRSMAEGRASYPLLLPLFKQKINQDINFLAWFAAYSFCLFLAAFFLTACGNNIVESELSPSYSSDANGIDNTSPFSFTGKVVKGETFEKALPNNLVFRLSPIVYADDKSMGWDIYISPAEEPSHNYSGIVTPPFRGTNTLHILGWHFRNVDNTGPNDGSVNAPQEKRGFYFVLNGQGYQTASEALECIMWPVLCENTDTEKAYQTHQSVPTTRGELKITRLELGNLEPGEQAWIEEMEFEVVLELPENLME